MPKKQKNKKSVKKKVKKRTYNKMIEESSKIHLKEEKLKKSINPKPKKKNQIYQRNLTKIIFLILIFK